MSIESYLGALVIELKVQSDSAKKAFAEIDWQVKAIASAVIAMEVISVKAWDAFDEAITHSTAMVANSSESMKRELGDAARTMALNGTTSALELASAYNTLNQAGIKAGAMAATLQQTNTFAIATNSKLEESTHALNQALRTLGLTSDDVAVQTSNLKGLSNELVQAEQAGGGSAIKMAEALGGRLGLEMRSLGIHTEEGISLLMAFNKAGVDAAEASQMLARIINALQRNVAQHGDAWRKANVDVVDAKGNLLPMADIMRNMTDRMKGMSDEQRRTFLETLGFQDRFTDSQILALQALGRTSDGIKAQQAALHGLGETANEVAQMQMSSFDASAERLHNLFMELKLGIGSSMNDTIEEVMGFMGNVLTLVNTLFDRFARLINFLGGAATRAALSLFGGEILKILAWFYKKRNPDEPSGEITNEVLDKTSNDTDPMGRSGKEVSARSFESISLRRFNLEALAKSTKHEVQQVGDKTAHHKLDRIAEILGHHKSKPGVVG